MRLTRIQLTGYSRFRSADSRVDEHVIAFVGPNEAGKSTLLRALDWLTDPKAKALPWAVRNRENPPEDYEVVVRAVFVPSSDELDRIRNLKLDVEEDLSSWSGVKFSLERMADGSARTVLTPALHRNLGPLHETQRLMEVVRTADGVDERAVAIIDALEALLDPSAGPWSESREAKVSARQNELDSLVEELKGQTLVGEGEPSVHSLIDLLSTLPVAIECVSSPEPDEVAREHLAVGLPRFLLFKDEHRVLPAVFNVLNNDGNVPLGLLNLLTVAGTSVAELADAIGRGATARQTEQRRINASLAVVANFWSQNRADGRRLYPHISVNETGNIDIGIDDVEGVVAINERSDGLQTYLALVAFILSNGIPDTPTILLIDEAERNLHYDAQGDLVRLLTNDLPVSQVLYTTHSPGCLPLDLGNGIRVVSRSKDNAKESQISDRFWTDNQPGFSRLLMVMGAGAAAFSALNSALLTEGPSEMILLPHLLRKADPESEIDFQVSFGLSNMSIPRDIGEVAIKTVFLVDGDKGGNDKMRHLAKAGV